tara:strand:- start:1062 stop:1379 length:318 start_codon:yes stop_codon:yes gene_type:complete
MVSTFVLLLGTKSANSEPTMIEAPPTIISINHLCFPTGSVLDTWRENGETISIIGNVRQTNTNPPGQILITTKDDGEWTILYNIQTPKVNITCIILHGNDFTKVR